VTKMMGGDREPNHAAISNKRAVYGSGIKKLILHAPNRNHVNLGSGIDFTRLGVSIYVDACEMAFQWCTNADQWGFMNVFFLEEPTKTKPSNQTRNVQFSFSQTMHLRHGKHLV